MRFIVLALFCLFLAGCSRCYVKANMTQEQFQRDVYMCKQQALASCMGNIFIARSLIGECMQSKGYHEQK